MSEARSRLRRSITSTLMVLAVLATVLVGAPTANAASLTTEDLNTLTAAQLAGALVGPGVTVSNVQFTGAPSAAGAFAGGGTGPGATIGFEEGVLLSSGDVSNVVGPNTLDGITTAQGQPGDTDLDALLPQDQTSEDASVLTFDFVPDASSISFRYVFSSDEYNEFVGSSFNDVFGFFVNGSNCAVIGESPVSVNTINGGNPFGNTDPQQGTVASHPELFRNNDPSDLDPPPIDTEMDGLTTILACVAAVEANGPNTMKLAIADVGDDILDSDVFIEAGSLTTEPPGDKPGEPTDVSATPGDASAIVGWTAPASDGGSAIDGYTVTCTATGNPDDTHTATADGTSSSAQVTGLTNDVEYTCVVTAHNANGDSEPSAPSLPFTPTAPTAQFSATINTGEGGVLLLIPEGPDNLGTTGAIVIPPQPGPAAEVEVTASLFGQPGETDDTCGGHVCIGQGIEWAVSDPHAIKWMLVKFVESPKLTHGAKARNAIVYKDGVPVKNCYVGHSRHGRHLPCVAFKFTTRLGGWRIALLVDGSDPKGRV